MAVSLAMPNMHSFRLNGKRSHGHVHSSFYIRAPIAHLFFWLYILHI